MAKKKDNKFALQRPKAIEKGAWEILIDSWENGLSDREAVFRLNREGYLMTHDSLRNILDGCPKAMDVRDFLRSELVAQAKLNIAESIREGSVSTTKWYLERKAPDEFSSKAAVALESAIVQVSMEEKRAEIDKFLEGFGISNNKEAEKEPIHFLGEDKDGSGEV